MRDRGASRAVGGALAALLACGSPALAAPTSPPALTLQEALRTALATSHALEGAGAKVDQARGRAAEVGGRRLPTVTLGVAPGVFGTFDSGLSRLLAAVPGLSYQLVAVNAVATETLFDGFRTRDAGLAASASVAQAIAGQDGTRQAVAYGVAGLYVDVLRAEALEANVRQAALQARRHLDQARVLERHGALTHVEVLHARVRAAQADNAASQAESAVTLARLALSAAMHVDLGARPLAVVPPMPSGVTENVKAAVEKRPEVRGAVDELEVQGHQVDLARDEAWPTVALVGLYAQLGLDQLQVYAAGVSLSWTAYDGGRRDAREAEARAAVRVDQAQLAHLREGYELEVRQAVAERDEARRRVVAAQAAVDAARADRDQAASRFAKGAATAFEETDAEAAVTEARTDLIQATYDLAQGQLKLDRALGIDLVTVLAPG